MDSSSSLVDEPVVAPPSLLALPMRWARRPVVGRARELTAIEQGLATAKSGRLATLTFEGEPGIGKTRLLVTVAEAAETEGFVAVAVTADEEIRGPFLLARALFSSAAAAGAAGGVARADLRRVVDAISGRDQPGLQGLSPDEKLLRVFDLGAVAVRALASALPLALVIDDLQWADDDSIRMLRYIVRADADVPLFLAFGVRRDGSELLTEAGPLLADMERMDLVRRLSLPRLTPLESAAVLREALSGEVDPTSAATMHGQSEGVPFILEEIARSYREAGLVQEIDGVWSLAKNADRLVPSAVRTLIQRRAARLPEFTRELLAEAAVLGRSFSLRDLGAVKGQLGGQRTEADAFAEALAPAVSTGLLAELPATSAGDYRFTHEQVRQFAAATLTVPRRRALHAALVDMLTNDADPAPESLPLLAHHALAAGEDERAARFSIQAAQAALAARAPEEALRLVDAALAVVAAPQDRITLLQARDDALEMLHRAADRLETLAELAALGEALGDPELDLDTMLRRAAAMRIAEDEERAAELAREVRRLAGDRGDRRAELAACLQLGQALMRRPLGESFTPPAREVDLDGASEAYECVTELAEALGDTESLAAATRELGVIDAGRSRAWFIDLLRKGEHLPLVRRIAAGESVESIMAELPVAPIASRARDRIQKAVELYDELGDRRGFMSSVIALGWISFGLDIHFHGSAKPLDEIQRLGIQLTSLSKASDRDRTEVHMLYGVHVFAQAKAVADLALWRGEKAYDKARMLGDRTLEFAAAGGVAMTHRDLGDAVAAEQWLDRAAAVATASPTPFRARQLLLWRGMCAAATLDTGRMRHHLEQAVRLAGDQGRPAPRCEALARLALEAARLATATGDVALLALAERSAQEAQAIVPVLPGHPVWGAQAASALALVGLARQQPAAAAEAAREALASLVTAAVDDLNLEIVLPAARAICEGGSPEERQGMQDRLRLELAMVAQRILDEEIRVRWFRGRLGRELTELAGSLDALPGVAADGDAGGSQLTEADTQLLRLVVEGYSNGEIADALGVASDDVEQRLRSFYARIGTSSRAEAAAFAFRERAI